jgi:hypothetical protein
MFYLSSASQHCLAKFSAFPGFETRPDRPNFHSHSARRSGTRLGPQKDVPEIRQTPVANDKRRTGINKSGGGR